MVLREAERIRPAASRDAMAVAALHARSWRVAYRGLLSDRYLDSEVDAEREREWRRRFAQLTPDTFAVFIAEDTSGPIGFAAVMLESTATSALLDNLHVVPDRQRHGIGRRLIAETARWTLNRSPGASLYLWVLEANADARRFYQALGAAERGVEPHEMPDGSMLTAIRCEWHDPRVLLAGLERP